MAGKEVEGLMRGVADRCLAWTRRERGGRLEGEGKEYRAGRLRQGVAGRLWLGVETLEAERQVLCTCFNKSCVALVTQWQRGRGR